METLEFCTMSRLITMVTQHALCDTIVICLAAMDAIFLLNFYFYFLGFLLLRTREGFVQQGELTDKHGIQSCSCKFRICVFCSDSHRNKSSSHGKI